LPVSEKEIKAIKLTTILLTLGIFAAGIGALGPGGLGQTKQAPRFNPDGAFFLIGEPPADFSDLSGIYLNGRRLRRIPTQSLQLNNGKMFHYKTLTVKQEDFSFTTETLRGVYYTFAGKFLRGGVFAEQDLADEKPVLEGVLTKYKDGKKVAGAKLKFSYFGGT
jgi:hypothetical protein